MLYLLDANVLIRAHEDYYGIEQVPQFWDWLKASAEKGIVKMPFEIHDEIAVSTGRLKDWITTADVASALILDEQPDQALVNRVLIQGYAPDLSDSEIETVGRDPFLVAYALARPDRIVVTKEVSKPSKLRSNRRLPDVCASLGVKWTKDFDFYKAAGFRTM